MYTYGRKKEQNKLWAPRFEKQVISLHYSSGALSESSGDVVTKKHGIRGDPYRKGRPLSHSPSTRAGYPTLHGRRCTHKTHHHKQQPYS